MPITVRVPSTAPGARFTTYAVTLDDGEHEGDFEQTHCECKGWRFHGHCKHGAAALSAVRLSLATVRCTCPAWSHADDFDGPQDHAAACAWCPVHG